MAFKINSVALAAAIGLVAGATSVHAQTTTKPPASTPAATAPSTPAAGTPAPTASMAKPVAKTPMKPMHMARARTSTSASAQDAAVDKLNEQSLAAARAGKTPSVPSNATITK